MNNTVNLEINESVATVTLNRPEARNAINIEMIDGFHASLDAIEKDKEIRAVIITGAGKSFCSGGDLNHPLFRLDTTDERRPIIKHIYDVPKRIHKIPVPFIAAINGPAIGGGVTLAGFCDLRIASDSAVFILNYVGIGVLPDFGGCYFLPHVVGIGKAMELAMLGEKFDAREAFRIGLVNKIIPDGELMTEARKTAQKLANMPPLAIGHIKKAIYNLPKKSMDEALDTEAEYFNYLIGTNDCREGAKAFMEKRVPRYTGK
jgi:2-(1,2-epoxy-1,2-dihydrophenyl)acetyl-CoA isomerase